MRNGKSGSRKSAGKTAAVFAVMMMTAVTTTGVSGCQSAA